MQLYVRLSKMVPGAFDAAQWSSFIQSQPRVMELLTAPAYTMENSNGAMCGGGSDGEGASVRAGKDEYDAFFGVPCEAERAAIKKGRPKGSTTQKVC